MAAHPKLADVGRESLAAVLFDMGGTLLEYAPEESAVGRRSLRKGCRRGYDWLRQRGRNVPDFKKFLNRQKRALIWRRLWNHLRGRELPAQNVVLEVLTRMGVEVPPEDIHDLIQCYYRDFGDTLAALDGARDTLAELAGLGLRLGVISNTAWPGYLLEEDLARFGLLEYLGVCLFSSYFGRRKPGKRIFRQALRMLEVTADEAIFVGDSLKHDIWGAHRVGMRTVLIASQRSGNLAHIPHWRARPDWTINSLPELLPIVKSALGGQ